MVLYVPLLLGAAGLGALILPAIKKNPQALSTEDYKKSLPQSYLQYNQIPSLQSIPQTDPSKPTIVKVSRGLDIGMRLRSANPYNGVENPLDYINRESARMTKFVEGTMMISWDAIQSGTIVPGAPPYVPTAADVLGPLEELRAGLGSLLDVYWLANQTELHFPAPAESGVYVQKLIFDAYGMSSSKKV